MKPLIRLALSVNVILICAAVANAQLPPVPEDPSPDAGPQPKLYVAQRTIDLGTILEGEKPTLTWNLENRGNANLIIEQTRASCGCTVVQLAEDQKVIPPNGSLALNVEFNSTGRRGVQKKSITVITNDPTEPMLKLTFTATLQMLYEMNPSKLVNLRSIQRGMQASQVIEIVPASGHQRVELLEIDAPDQAPVRFETEEFTAASGAGVRIRMRVDQYVALGALQTNVRLRFRVDGMERERVVPIRGQVVGDLIWTPRVVDATRNVSPPGQRLAPVTVRSTNDTQFEIVSAGAGPYLDVAVKPKDTGGKKTTYTVDLTLRDGVKPGPFATSLRIRTNLLDQPEVNIPVFGIAAAPVEVEPPVVMLRKDGTPAGTHRRVKLQVLPRLTLDITSITCNHDAVEASIDQAASGRYRHIRFLDVRLVGSAPPGVHEAVLSVRTNIEGADLVEIPVIVDIPRDRG